jgi:hypothetical protein
MRPREVASGKVVARYGYVENPRISPAKAELLIAVQAKQQYVVLICELYSLDGLTLAGAGPGLSRLSGMPRPLGTAHRRLLNVQIS